MELWDLYDKDRTPLHRTHPRGTPLPEGAYHVAVIVVVVNSKGQVLLTRRAPEKDACPGWWENTGGSVLAGETSLQAIQRELREETGAVAGDFQSLGELYPSPGYCGEIIRMYLARDLSFGDTDPDEDEFLGLERIPFDRLVEQVLSGEIKDAKTIAAVLKAKLLLGL